MNIPLIPRAKWNKREAALEGTPEQRTSLNVGILVSKLFFGACIQICGKTVIFEEICSDTDACVCSQRLVFNIKVQKSNES